MRYFCFVASLCVFLLVSGVSAEITFFPDFWPRSVEVVPDKSVNDPLNYIPENPLTVWTVGRFGEDFLGKGVLNDDRGALSWDRHALIQIADGCRTSGYTPFPGVTDFKDGTIQLVVSFRSDHGFGIQFRRKGQGEGGYMVHFGYLQSPFVTLMELPNPCLQDGKCLFQLRNCFETPNVLDLRPHQLGGHYNWIIVSLF